MNEYTSKLNQKVGPSAFMCMWKNRRLGERYWMREMKNIIIWFWEDEGWKVNRRGGADFKCRVKTKKEWGKNWLAVDWYGKKNNMLKRYKEGGTRLCQISPCAAPNPLKWSTLDDKTWLYGNWKHNWGAKGGWEYSYSTYKQSHAEKFLLSFHDKSNNDNHRFNKDFTTCSFFTY